MDVMLLSTLTDDCIGILKLTKQDCGVYDPITGNKKFIVAGVEYNDELVIPQKTTTERMALTPSDGAMIYDTNEKNLYLGNGSTAGGVLCNHTVFVHVYTTMPAVSTVAQGQIALYSGATAGGFTQGHIYRADAGGWTDITAGGGGGTSDYAQLSNKPQIGGVTLSGNKTAEDLGLAEADDIPTTLAELDGDSEHRTVTDANIANWNSAAPVQSDWDVTDSASMAYIKHKPAIPVYPLGYCTNLGVYQGDAPQFSWEDPADVIINGCKLAKWSRTVLVRKANSYPTAWNDGTLLTQTSQATNSRDYYRDHMYIDISVEQGVAYYYKLFSQTDSGAWNDLTENQYDFQGGMSWNQVQQFVRAGRGAEIFPIGSVFVVPHSEYGNINWRVSGHDQVPCTDTSLTHSMCLEMTGILFNDMFDAAELQYALTWDTTAQAVVTYYKYQGGSYIALVAGTDYQIGDPVPLASWYVKNPNNGVASNQYSVSNLRQWANSNGTANSWFTAQTPWDLCSTTLAAKNGFCYGLDSSFLSVVKQAKLTTNRYSAYGGGQEVTNDKFWPLSSTQVFGGGTENIRLQYYVNLGSAIKKLNGTAGTWWFRSPVTYSAVSVFYVTASGTSNSYYADYAYGVSLACLVA